MSKQKKYFWLKLKDNFFSDPKIKKLRRIAGGDTYTVIYLKMMLLSIKNGGLIEFQGIEKTLSDELSLILDEDEINVNATLIYLDKMGMIETISEQSYLMQNVPELVGCETDSAERVRRLRANKALQCNIDVTTCNTEIEKEKELEKEIDINNNHLPICINPTVWAEWVQHRKEIKKALTPTTIKKQLKQLEEFNRLGMDTTEVINASISAGYTGLFALRTGKKYEPPKSKIATTMSNYDKLCAEREGKQNAIEGELV